MLTILFIIITISIIVKMLTPNKKQYGERNTYRKYISEYAIIRSLKDMDKVDAKAKKKFRQEKIRKMFKKH